MRAAVYTASFKNRALFGGDHNRSAADDSSRVNQPNGGCTKADYQAGG